jgi:hypothetical protein
VTIRLPDVPDPLPDLEDDHIVTVPAGWPLARAHDVAGPYARQFFEPRFYGPLADKGRFDHHPAGPPADHEPDHGVIYAACDSPTDAPPAAIAAGDGSQVDTVVDVVCAELVQETDVLHITAGLTLTVFTLAEDLQLLDLRGSWTQRTRAGTHLSTAEHTAVHPWARAIRAQYPQLHGLLYVPSTGGRAVAVVLNESAAPALKAGEVILSRPFSDPSLLGLIGKVGERIGFAII